MHCPLAGRFWRDTDSRGWVPPGRRIRRQRTPEFRRFRAARYRFRAPADDAVGVLLEKGIWL
jgi:hypothetical protein